MAGDNHEGRLSTVEADIKNIANGITRIENNLSKAADKHDQRHTEVLQRLTVIETSQKGFQKYQEECDNDREDYRKRIESLERLRSQQQGAFWASKLFANGLGAIAGAVAGYFAGRH